MPKRKPQPAASTTPPARKISARVECPIFNSFRTDQVAGLMDLPPAARAVETFDVELPALEDDWRIGVIVGPSGTGKSTIAREAFGAELYHGGDWPTNAAVVDGFPEALSIKQIAHLLTAVGFSQPPAWVKPYHVLSNGQKFRCDLARALLTAGDSRLVVFDEFTSVVDRTVAKVGSLAVAKAVRGGAVDRADAAPLRFVAVTCHYDVVEWLEPDWILDMGERRLARGSLRRPSIELELFRADAAAWRLFKPHHYLSANVPSAARYYLATWNGEPVGLVVVGNFFGTPKLQKGQKGRRLISRIVVLPDYQGIGIAGRMLDAVGELLTAEGYQVTITTGHPGMAKLLDRSPRWRVTRTSMGNRQARQPGDGRKLGGSFGRFTVTAQYLAATAAPL